MASLRAVIHGERPNALVGWMLTGVVTFVAVRSFLTDSLLWGGFALVVVVVTAIPAVVTGEWTAMVTWPLLSVAAVAMVAGALGLYLEIAGYLAVVALALVVVVELDAFTSVEMSRRFAVGFAALTTLAVQGLWTIAQYYSDRWLGTAYLHSQRELQVDIVMVTVIGIVVSAGFERYFDRVEPVESRTRPKEASPRS